jgi:nitroreductase
VSATVDPRTALLTVPAPSATWRERVTYALAGLIVSPSVHNTQPWRLRLGDGDTVLDLWADDKRRLPRLDPCERQLMLSLGSGLHGLEVAARAAGITTNIRMLPRGQRGPAARVLLHPAPSHSPDAFREVVALAQRRTYRGDLLPEEPGAVQIATLAEAAQAAGARLHRCEEGQDRRILQWLTTRATWEQSHDRALVAELLAWTRAPGDAREDGVPAASWGKTTRAAWESIPAQRDFALGRQVGTGQSQGHVTGVKAPVIAVLLSQGDGTQAWLTAGRALHWVLIAAWEQGLAGSLVDAAVEIEETRATLRRHLGVPEWPQAVLRLGRPASALPPTTPRRSLDEVLQRATR